MTPSADNISQLRRMINEPTDSPYTDVILTTYVEAYPLLDSEGRETGDTDWVESYDLNAAAADIWSEKASLVLMYYDFSADGGKYTQSQLYVMAMDKARYHQARRKPSSRYIHKHPVEIDTNEAGLIWDEAYAWWRL